MTIRITHVSVGGTFKAGDQPPEGYNDWHEWASVQHKAGLRQEQCCLCSLWRFPQQFGPAVHVSMAQDRLGRPVELRGKVCKKCESKTDQKEDA